MIFRSNKGRFFVEFSPRSENSRRKVSVRSLGLEISLRTNNRLPRVIMFVYLSSQQHGIFLNVFPTFFSHHNKDTYYLRLNTVDKRTKQQKVITSDSRNLPLILNGILTFYFACRRQCRRLCFFGGHRTCFSFLFFFLFPQLNFTFPL